MKYTDIDVVYQEVPGEISLAFFISGCNIGCKGCHSKEFWDHNKGENLTDGILKEYLNKYNTLISCVLFYGGEWNEHELIKKLKIIKKYGLKTCLYTGLSQVNDNISTLLDYIKTGPYIESMGPITEKTTNQRFIDLNQNCDITSHFWRLNEKNSRIDKGTT